MMSFKISEWIFAILFMLCSFLSIADETEPELLNADELGAFLKKIETSLSDITSLETKFRQEKHISILSEAVESTGILYFQKPKSIRFEIVTPYHSILVTNGKSVAQFELIDGTWTKLRTGGAGVILLVTDQIASWLQGNFEEQMETFEISAKKGAHHLFLRPTDPKFAEFIQRIELTFSDDLSVITRLEIHEPSDDYTVIEFEETRQNPLNDKDLFKTSGKRPFLVLKP